MEVPVAKTHSAPHTVLRGAAGSNDRYRTDDALNGHTKTIWMDPL